MARKITLLRYAKKPKESKEPDKEVIGFLKAGSKGKLLIINAGPEINAIKKLGYDVTVIDEDFSKVKKSKELHENIKFEYIDFFNFARRSGRSAFDTVLDNGYSDQLLRTRHQKYFIEVAKLLKYNGILITKVLSVTDDYCKAHCPKRQWTYIDDHHVNFFEKKGLLRLLKRSGFHINKHLEKTANRTYHYVHSTLKLMKL